MSGYIKSVTNQLGNNNTIDITANSFRILTLNAGLMGLVPGYALKFLAQITNSGFEAVGLTNIAVPATASVYQQLMATPLEKAQHIDKNPDTPKKVVTLASTGFMAAGAAYGLGLTYNTLMSSAHLTLHAFHNFGKYLIPGGSTLAASNGFVLAGMCLTMMVDSSLRAVRAKKKQDPKYLFDDRNKKYEKLVADLKSNLMHDNKFVQSLQKKETSLIKAQWHASERKKREIQTALAEIADRRRHKGHTLEEREAIRDNANRMAVQAAAIRDYKNSINTEAVKLDDFAPSTIFHKVDIDGNQGEAISNTNAKLGEYLVNKQHAKHIEHTKNAISWGISFTGAVLFGLSVFFPPLLLAGVAAFTVSLSMNAADISKGYGSSFLGIKSSSRKRFEAGFEKAVLRFSHEGNERFDQAVKTAKENLEKSEQALSDLTEHKPTQLHKDIRALEAWIQRYRQEHPAWIFSTSNEYKEKKKELNDLKATLKSRIKDLKGKISIQSEVLLKVVENAIVREKLDEPVGTDTRVMLSDADHKRITSDWFVEQAKTQKTANSNAQTPFREASSTSLVSRTPSPAQSLTAAR